MLQRYGATARAWDLWRSLTLFVTPSFSKLDASCQAESDIQHGEQLCEPFWCHCHSFFFCTGWIDESYAKNRNFCVFGIWYEIKGRAQIFGWPARVFQWVSSSSASMTRSQGRMGCIAEILCFGRHCILLYCSRSRLEAQKRARLLGNVHNPGIDQKKSHCTFGIGSDVLQICPVLSAIKSGRLLKAVPSLQVMGPFAPWPSVRSDYFWNLLDLSVLHHMSPWFVNCPVLKNSKFE